MIEVYLDAAIRQARERARLLQAKIPRPVPAAELIALQRLCEDRLDDIISQIDYLLTDEVILMNESVKARMRIFRRILVELSQLETTGITALSRVHSDDIFLNRLVFQIHQEIIYPLSPPTVTCLSRDYFSINTSLHLLEVPLAEADFLLHLPDLYHEVAHLLITAMNNPKVQPFQVELGRFLFAVDQYFDGERATNARATGPTQYFAQVLDVVQRDWIPWATEIFCDLFAVYTLGPAYAWSHFHLTAGQNGAPYDVRLTRLMSHPPDQARLEAMLTGLELIGFDEDSAVIRRTWAALVECMGAVQAPIYRKACPQQLLQQAAIHALEGTKKIGCRIVTASTSDLVHTLLNAAWREFWTTPEEYLTWERQAINQLKQCFSR